MKMEITDKVTLIGGIALLLIMIVQMYSHFQFDAVFNESQIKRLEYVQRDLVNSGFSESQANSITGAIRDESFSLKSTMSSEIMMQPYATTMSCLIVLMMMTWAIKKSIKKD